MTDDPTDPGGAEADSDPKAATDRRRRRARRRRDLDEVFGDVLPSVTSDESPSDSSRPRSRPSPDGADPRDEEILRDVPPHHN
jgi:hypothetical protein